MGEREGGGGYDMQQTSPAGTRPATPRSCGMYYNHSDTEALQLKVHSLAFCLELSVTSHSLHQCVWSLLRCHGDCSVVIT